MRLLVAGQLAASTLTITSRFFAARITAEHANDGDDALHLARHDTFDVILLDVSLSGLSGGQFIRRLRDARCNIPVIVLGPSMPGTERARLLDLGADDIIIHPLDGEEVAARVRAVVRRACGHAKSELRWGPLALHLDRRAGHRLRGVDGQRAGCADPQQLVGVGQPDRGRGNGGVVDLQG